VSQPTSRDPDALLAEVLAGRLDALTPDQVVQLEAHLRRDPAAEAALAGAAPPRPDLPDEPLPSTRTWDALWTRIDEAASIRQRRGGLRARAWWRPVVAAAACGLAMLAWKRLGAPSFEPIVLARDVVIESMEVGRGESAFVVYLDGGSGPPVVWVFDEAANGAGHVQ